MGDPSLWSAIPEIEQALHKAGFEELRVEQHVLPFAFPSTQAYRQFIFGGKNPSVEKVLNAYPGDKQLIGDELEKIIRKQYGSGTNIKLSGVVGVGRKPL